MNEKQHQGSHAIVCKRRCCGPDPHFLCQDAPKRRPRGAQEPKTAQEAPKSSRRATKTRPGDAQTHPKSSPARPRTSFQRNLRVKFHSESVWTVFLSFFVLHATCAMCDPHNKNCGFCTIGALSSCALAGAKKQEKTSTIDGLGMPKPSPDPPEALQNRAGAIQNARKRPRATTKTTKSTQDEQDVPQDAPKSENEPT